MSGIVRVFAADVGLATCGVAIVDTNSIEHTLLRAMHYGVAVDEIPEQRLIKHEGIGRMRLLARWWREVLSADAGPRTVVAIEEVHFSVNAHTAAMTAYGTAAFVLEADRMGIPVIGVTPNVWRGLLGAHTQGRGGTVAEKRKRAKEREERAHVEVQMRIRGADNFRVRYGLNKADAAHCLDGLGIAYWACGQPLVRGMCAR